MLGISIYPEHQTIEQIKNYINSAHKLGYKRIFSSLIEINKNNKKELIAKFSEIIQYARELEFEFVLDVNPQIFEYLNISYDNLEFFANLKCSGIRLDDVISAKTVADLTHNQFDLDIEINCSNSKYLIDEVLEFEPIRRKLIACHNFYPQELTGLDFEYFLNVTKNYKKNNIRVGAFVSADKEHATFGPGTINDGICTIENYRKLPIHTQAKLLKATNLVDDIIIGNAFASYEELEKLANTNYDIIELDVILSKDITNTEKEIIFDFEHFRRGDITSFMVRSTMSRVVYQDYDFIPSNNKTLPQRGDILICNNLLKSYKGELHLILNEIAIDERKNKVAQICEYDKKLLTYISPWKRFKFKEVKNKKG